jgi:di/tricarboxylate transporter
MRFRQRYGMTVLSIWRKGRPFRTALTDLALEFGDALLLLGPWHRIPVLRTEPDLVVLDRGHSRPAVTRVSTKGYLAVAVLAAALILAAFNTPLIGPIMLGAALLLVMLGVLSMDQAYVAVEWRSFFLVAGMLPLGLAMTKSGAAALLADVLVKYLIPLGPLALLAGIFILTTLLTQTMSGAAVATVIAPVAIQAATQAGLEPRSYAMAVALATSMAFITPLGHPVNVLVMGPGGYSFRDFLRVGVPLTLLLFALVMFLLPIFWPLAPK